MNKQNKNRPVDTENTLAFARAEGSGRMGEKDKGN